MTVIDTSDILIFFHIKFGRVTYKDNVEETRNPDQSTKLK